MKASFRQGFLSGNGRISKDRVRELLSASLSLDEVETLLQHLPAGGDGTVAFDHLVDFVFDVTPVPAGGAVSAARALRNQSQTQESPDLAIKNFTCTDAPPPPDDLERSTTISPSKLASNDSVGCSSPCGRIARVNSTPGKQCEWAVPTQLDRGLAREFMELDQRGKVQAEYVWLDSDFSDGHSFDLCSKSLTLDSAPQCVQDLPHWSYSGEDDGFAVEVILVPCRMYRDPFRRGQNIIVWTECFKCPREGSNDDHGPPVVWNSRHACDEAMTRAINEGEEPWFGIEQEYYLLNAHTSWPLGWPTDGFPGPQGAYFCSTGAAKAPGRDVVESHYRACLYAGVKIGGINSEVAPGQWEFQVGPCLGVAAADDLWMARFLLQRICELFQVSVTFDPKPVPDWAGTGCHTNYSTKSTRSMGGYDVIQKHCERLRQRHGEHMKAYGESNERRLIGNDETQSIDKFSYGVGDRGASIRIPVKVAAQGFGYYEDRRPASNMDPYQVCRMIVETTLFHDDDVNPTLKSPSMSKRHSKGNVMAGLAA